MVGEPCRAPDGVPGAPQQPGACKPCRAERGAGAAPAALLQPGRPGCRACLQSRAGEQAKARQHTGRRQRRSRLGARDLAAGAGVRSRLRARLHPRLAPAAAGRAGPSWPRAPRRLACRRKTLRREVRWQPRAGRHARLCLGQRQLLQRLGQRTGGSRQGFTRREPSARQLGVARCCEAACWGRAGRGGGVEGQSRAAGGAAGGRGAACGAGSCVLRGQPCTSVARQ